MSRVVARIPGAQGFGRHNPSIGGMLPLGIMEQNRKAGGNNVCAFTDEFGVKRTPPCDEGGGGDNEGNGNAACCSCQGPKAYCPNCWERKTRFTLSTK